MSALRIDHPAGGVIVPMQSAPEQFRHVIRHLYRQRECWHQLGMPLAGALKESATRSGCRPVELAMEQPSYHSAPAECIKHVLIDYREHYEPAYWEALRSAIATGQWGRDTANPSRELFVGKNSVVVLTRRTRERLDGAQLFVVVSARRHLPQGIRWQDAKPEDFVQQALQDLARQTS